MRKILCWWLILLSVQAVDAQSYEYVYRDVIDSSRNCYVKAIPEQDVIRGLIVRDYSSLPDVRRKPRFQFKQKAIDKGFLVLYVVTSVYFPDMYLDDTGPALLDEIVNEVIQAHDIPPDNIFVGGISSSGTRALRYAQYCAEQKSKYQTKIAGVFMVDSPLDHERFYRSSEEILAKGLGKGHQWEAELMIKTYREQFGGPPDEQYEKYRQASVYCHSDPDGGNAQHYTDVPMCIYHEPDIDWWMEARGETYQHFNSIDIAAFVNEVRRLGNKDVELITTTGKGYDRSGERMPHSWSIVDEDYLVGWVLDRCSSGSR